jgi:hypothetical protein
VRFAQWGSSRSGQSTKRASGALNALADPRSACRPCRAGHYHNAENGFCVLRAKARGHRDLVTVVGHSATISAGEWIIAAGDWTNDRTHGQQFKARFLRTETPTSSEGIEKYLCLGMIRGIGPVYARKLVRAFAEKVFDVIEAQPERLQEVDGIGPVRGPTDRGRLGRAESRARDHGVFSTVMV